MFLLLLIGFLAQKQIPLVKQLANGISFPQSTIGEQFEAYCPSIANLIKSFVGGALPAQYRFFLRFLIDKVELPFAGPTINVPLPDLLAQPKLENYLEEGHLYSWPIIRESKRYTDYVYDGYCHKKEDKQKKNFKNLVPGIFVCVCRHQVCLKRCLFHFF